MKTELPDDNYDWGDILTHLPHMLLVFDTGKKLLHISPKAKAILQQPELLGIILEHIGPALEASLKSGQAYQPKTYQSTCKVFIEQQTRFLLPRYLPFPDAEGKCPGVVVELLDITEFVHLDEAKNELLGTVSHELKSPVASTRMALAIALEENLGPLTPSLRDLLQTAHKEVERLLQTLETLLNLRQFEEGKGDLDFEELQPCELLESVAAHSGENYHHNKWDLRIEVEDDLPTLFVNKARLRQCLINYLDNALKYGPPDQPVTLRALRVDEGVRFEVADLGPGLSPEQKDRVFEKFQRLSRDAEKTGTGLGLSIVNEMVRAHHGKAGVEDNYPTGCIFYFTIPVPPLRTQNTGGVSSPKAASSGESKDCSVYREENG